MNFKKFLNEEPLPPDWENISAMSSFKKILAHAREKSKRIGGGSSRVAFTIPYEGRQTVLKIAKNKKGIAQNEYESSLLNDYYVQSLNVTIPIIDHDEEKNIWIHMEKAEKVTEKEIEDHFGCNLVCLNLNIMYVLNKPYWRTIRHDEIIDLSENENFQKLLTLVGNFDLQEQDLMHIGNWGKWQGKPVVIDLGLSEDIYKTYY